MANATAYLQQFTWNGHTYNSGSGGPIKMEYMKTGEPLEDWTGDNEYPPFLAVVSKRLRVRLTLRDVKFTDALGVKGNGVATLLPKIGGTPVGINLAGLVLIGGPDAGEQVSRQVGSSTLIFAHESADGSTDPVT